MTPLRPCSLQGPRGDVQVYDQGMGSMAGSFRVVGGLGRVTQRLAEQLPAERVMLGTVLKSLSFDEGAATIRAELLGPGDRHSIISAKAVAIAAPPQLVEATVAFSPELPGAAVTRMKQIPTWMAGALTADPTLVVQCAAPQLIPGAGLTWNSKISA